MKTTLELPDELMRRVKIRAAEKNQKLKDTVAELIQKGFAAPTSPQPPKLPVPIKLKGGFKPTTEDIEAAIAWGRD
jgi:plasmid stability protein